MIDDRLRVPVDDAYVVSLGRAMYVFSTLEWNVVWCLEKMIPSYISRVSRKTAGQIAADFIRFSALISDTSLRHDCTAVANRFDSLVRQRNGLAHAKPGTANDGSQRLFRDGMPWTLQAVNDLCDEFAACSIEANAILHYKLMNQPMP